MAYSDYVKIYNVWDSAGIASADNRATQLTKITDWINATFSDFVTADVFSDNDYIHVVRVIDNEVKAGFVWGQIYNTNNQNDRRYIYYNTSGYNYSDDESNHIDNNYPIQNLGLFTCFTENGYVMDFINLSKTNYTSYPRFISVKGMDSNGMAKRVCIGNNYYSSSNWQWTTMLQNKISPVVSNCTQQDFLGKTNNILSRTLLTKYAPVSEDIICDSLYKMDGVMPPCKTIFELDGVKYLSLNYNAYGNGCGLALKLE